MRVVHFEIGFSLFDSYAVVSPFIAWRNFKLKGRPEKERAYRKYGIRQARLDLIQKWSKLCSRHYKETSPHKNKRIRLVIPIILENTNFWDKRPTSEAWITIPRWASENTKGTRILLSLWGQNTPHVLGLLHGLSWCISDLPYFQVRLLSKVAWNAKWDMRTLP